MNPIYIIPGTMAICSGILAYGVFEPNSFLFGRAIGRGAKRNSYLYLTFDDGPNPTATEFILNILDKFSVPAAFFMVGKNVATFPSLAREVASSGQEIGNHTYRHKKLHFRGENFIRQEILETHELITKTTGIVPRMFRAPHGYRNFWVNKIAKELGYTTFGWTFGVWDTALPGSEVIRARVRRRLKPGAIILLHDGDGLNPLADRTETARALEGIIRDAQEDGYQFKPLRELMRGVPAENGSLQVAI